MNRVDPTIDSPWAGASPIASLAHAEGSVTLVEGQTFCLSGRRGDVSPNLPHGLFVLDTRVLSHWELRINGYPLEPLTVAMPEPYAATFVGRSHPTGSGADTAVVAFRRRHVGRGMRERFEITNHSAVPVPITVELLYDIDFADLFEVKESRHVRRGRHGHQTHEQAVTFTHVDDHTTKQVLIRFSELGSVEPGIATWRLTLEARRTWELCTEISVQLGGIAIEPRFTCNGTDEQAVPAQRMERWRATLPLVASDHPALNLAVTQSGEDLGALRIFDPEHPELPVLAAGAPWFMTVFGRDSLLTAWMTLLADPSLSRGVLETLARFQGTEVDPITEEEPGKILHEMRFGAATGMRLGGGDVYFGSIDATPLFVMLLGELRRWDIEEDLVRRLLPHADRAMGWIEEFGDRDGDGYVEYQRHNPRGLANQGWKDSWDAVQFADGTMARTPIALCEVQGYVYAAYLARAHLALELGDETTLRHCLGRATHLRRRFNEDFWLEDRGWFAMGLDVDKRPIDALASNIGHCLWTGIVDPELAGAVAERIMDPGMFSGWGVRTLDTSMAAYNPVSYHNGSVWPHDNAIVAAGLARYGFVEQAGRIIEAQLAVATAHQGRLPELFAGFDRTMLPTPASYPTSCSPQAWAAAAPLLWLRTLLRIDPWALQGQVSLRPALPPSITRLRVDGIEIAGRHLCVTVDEGEVHVEGAGDLVVWHEARTPDMAVAELAELAGRAGDDVQRPGAR